MNVQLTAAQPFSMRIIKQNADGSGVVEIPILTVGKLDLSLTASTGEGEWDVTLEVLNQMAENFGNYPGPVPVGFDGHVDYSGRARESEAFIDRLMVMGNALVAHVYVTPGRFQQIRSGMWRGFSVETTKDAKFPSRSMSGWFVFGGTFTNRPAADVVFTLPESVAAEMVHRIALGGDIGDEQMEKETKPVATEATKSGEQSVSLAFHDEKVGSLQAELSAANSRAQNLESRMATLQADLKAAREKVAEAESSSTDSNDAKLAAQVKARQAESEIKALREERRDLERRLNEKNKDYEELRGKSLSVELKQLRDDEINAGVPPVYFDGMDDDPVGWLDSRFKDIDALKDSCATLRGVGPKVTGKVVKSDPDKRRGTDPGEATALEGKDAEKFKMLRKQMGWKYDFSGVTTEAEAREIVEQAEAGAAQ